METNSKQLSSASIPITVIEPKRGWVPVDLEEIWKYRELLYFLTKRDIQVRYKQTILGGLWAVIQPTFTMVIFTFFFGRLAKMPSDGMPYPLFVYSALLAWTYFANAVGTSGNSLVGSANLITKIYFPRLMVPVSASLSGLLDFLIALFVLGALIIHYKVILGISILLFPVLVVLTFLCAVGVGLWLSALNVQYRDIRYVIPFLIQLWLFCSPVIYPVSMAKGNYKWILLFNPMSGVIKAYRACIMGHQPIDWGLLGLSTAIILLILITGLFYFRRMEKVFADVV